MLILIKADLLKIDVQYIVHQTNCTPGAMGGLAGDIAQKYPHANTRNGVCEVGKIDIFKPVINLYGQRSMGYPSKREPASLRLKWFKRGLWSISRINDLEEVAFPYMIGCGLAGGNWLDYENILLDFAHYVYLTKNVKVYLVKLP